MSMLRKLGCLIFTMQNGVCDICKYWQSVMLKGKVFIPVTPGHTGSINHDVSEKANFPHAVHTSVMLEVQYFFLSI